MGFFDRVFADAKKEEEEIDLVFAEATKKEEEKKYIKSLNKVIAGINEESVEDRISFYKDEFNYEVLEGYYDKIKAEQKELLTSEIGILKEVANIIADGKASPDLNDKYQNFKKNLSEANKTLYSMKILIALSNVNIKGVQRKALINKIKASESTKKHKISVLEIANLQHQLFTKKQGIDKAQQFLIDYIPEETKSMEEYSLLNFVARGTKNISKENNDIDFLKEQRENIQKINEFKTEIEEEFNIVFEVREKIDKNDIPKIKEYLEKQIASAESETQIKISTEILNLFKEGGVPGAPKKSQDRHPSPSLISRLKDQPIPNQEDITKYIEFEPEEIVNISRERRSLNFPKLSMIKKENIPFLEFAYIIGKYGYKSDYEFTQEDNESIKNGENYFRRMGKLFNPRKIQEIIDASKTPESVTKVEQPTPQGSPTIIHSSFNSGDLKASLLKIASENASELGNKTPGTLPQEKLKQLEEGYNAKQPNAKNPNAKVKKPKYRGPKM
jgi:hypothetical protein